MLQVWIALWSGLCFFSTLMTLTTFLIDTERFKYPERPIVFLSACYFMVSIGYLVRVFLGHEEVACEGGMIRYSSTGPVTCTMVFLLVYFFGMASSIWFVHQSGFHIFLRFHFQNSVNTFLAGTEIVHCLRREVPRLF